MTKKFLSLLILVITTSLLTLFLVQNSRYKKINLFARAASKIQVTVRKSGEAGAGSSTTNVYQNEAYTVRVINTDGTLYNGYLDFSIFKNGVWSPPAPWKDQNGNLIQIVNGETTVDFKNYRNPTTGAWLALGSNVARFKPLSTGNSIVISSPTPTPTPTPTPIPGCVNPPPPTLNNLGTVPPGNVSLSWSNTGAPSYYFRISPNGISCSQANDYCPNPINSTSIIRNLTAGTYTWWVHSVGRRAGVEDWSCYSTYSSDVFSVVAKTPTPTPAACASPGGPTGLTTTCNGAGTQATVSWNAAAGADYYSLRVNNTSYADVPGFCGPAGEAGGGPNDFCRTPVGTSYTFTVNPGQSYGWWVHSRVNCKSSYWSPALSSSFVCNAPTPTRTPTPTPGPISTRTSTPTPISSSTVTLYPTADTYVYKNYPSSNYGARSTLQVDGSPIKVIYMKFNLSSLSGRSVSSAKLKFKITNSSSSTQNIKRVSNTSWSETTLTYNNRPTLGTLITSFPGGSSGAWKEVNITVAVKEKLGQTMSFAIDSSGSDDLDIYSKDSSSKPRLTIRYN